MNSGPTLQAGSTGPDVRRLQRILVETKLLDFTHIDGSFAAATETAVKDFQEGNGLVSDGIVGPVTWAVLPADPMTPTLSRGSSGASVSALQKGLKTYSRQNAAADPGAIDGSFGPRTEAAVKAYQSDRSRRCSGRRRRRSHLVGAGRSGWRDARVPGRRHHGIKCQFPPPPRGRVVRGRPATPTRHVRPSYEKHLRGFASAKRPNSGRSQ